MSGIWLVAFVIQWVLLLMMGYALLVVMQHFGALYAALETVRVGEPETLKLIPGEAPPPLHLTDLAQQDVSLHQFGGGPISLTVISPACGPCKLLLQELATAPARQVGHAIVSVGTGADTLALIRALPSLDCPLLLASYSDIKAFWGVTATPTTIELDAAGRFVRHHAGYTPAPSGASERTFDSPFARDILT